MYSASSLQKIRVSAFSLAWINISWPWHKKNMHTSWGVRIESWACIIAISLDDDDETWICLTSSLRQHKGLNSESRRGGVGGTCAGGQAGCGPSWRSSHQSATTCIYTAAGLVSLDMNHQQHPYSPGHPPSPTLQSLICSPSHILLPLPNINPVHLICPSRAAWIQGDGNIVASAVHGPLFWAGHNWHRQWSLVSFLSPFRLWFHKL